MTEKNYITPKGFLLLKQEYHKLFHEERPKLVETIAWAASNGDRSENADYIYGKRRLREIDKRLHFLSHRLEMTEVVDPKTVKTDKISFGATVMLEDEEGTTFVYKLVGEDETNPAEGLISWRSPIGTALIGKKPGAEVIVKRPVGDKVYTIISISAT